MLYRLAFIIIATLLFGYSAGSLAYKSSSLFGVGARCSFAVAIPLAAMAAICFRHKALAKALSLWLGPTAIVIAAFAPWAPPWITLAISWLFAFILAAVTFVQMEDLGAAKPNHCEKCCYDLLGIEDGICPECGTPIVPPERSAERTRPASPTTP
jgi:hypothetical protein